VLRYVVGASICGGCFDMWWVLRYVVGASICGGLSACICGMLIAWICGMVIALICAYAYRYVRMPINVRMPIKCEVRLAWCIACNHSRGVSLTITRVVYRVQSLAW